MSTAALPPSAQGWPGAKHPAESGADFPHPGLDCLLVTQPTQKSDWGPLIQDGQVNIAGSGEQMGPMSQSGAVQQQQLLSHQDTKHRKPQPA